MTAHRIIFGDALDVLRSLEAESVDCCCTSPPYWGLRDYGVAGQIGLEATPEEYVARLVGIFAEVRRVLKPGGTCWVNLGDSYAREAAKGQHRPGDSGKQGYVYDRGGGRASAMMDCEAVGLKPKDLVGVPWRVAFALQADGWWLRNAIVWAKPNPMPESVTDRFSSTYEQVFLLAKAGRYWFDVDAVREPHSRDWSQEPWTHNTRRDDLKANSLMSSHGGEKVLSETFNPLGKNPGDVWRIATQPTPYAHFATFPEALVERMVRAGCAPKVCAECGEPWEHRVEKTRTFESGSGRAGNLPAGKQEAVQGGGETLDIRRGPCLHVESLGYHAACGCEAEALPGVVLDPFLGSGTTTQVARKLGRRSIGIELNPEYEAVMRQRLGCPEGALIQDVEFGMQTATADRSGDLCYTNGGG